MGEIQPAITAALEALPTRSAVTTAMLDFKTARWSIPMVPEERVWHEEFATWLWRSDAAWQSELEAWKQTAKR
jgi:hypothetical protein